MIDPAAARRHARAAERAGKGLSARNAAFLEHDPEKWKPVFRKRSRSAKEHDPEKWKPVSEKHALGLDPGDHALPESQSANRFGLKRLALRLPNGL
ncbi:MAG: hypothetical protein ACLQFW_20095 [Xanthobacteraceae bacterium]